MSKKTDPKTSVGKEVVGRLKRFAEKIQTLEGLGDLPDVLTVRKVKLDLKPRAFNASEIKVVREDLRVSQAVFADFLGVSASTVQDWEQGASHWINAGGLDTGNSGAGTGTMGTTTVSNQAAF